LERTNIDLQVYNSIVPSALNLARFKVSGELPTLQVNLSDTKYKSLMRLIDVCIPNFKNSDEVEDLATQAPAKFGSDAFHKPSGLFGPTEAEYNIEDDDRSSIREEQYFEADDGSIEVCCSTYIFLSVYNDLPSGLTCINTTSSSTFKYTICGLRYRSLMVLVSKNLSEMYHLSGSL
jgi:hypothetical protein